jgi:hypothetical protein
MADNILFLDPISNRSFPLNFSDLLTIIKGSSIKSAALSDDFFELVLTDAFNLRIETQPTILLTSTLNKNEFPPVRLQIIADGETPSAFTVERRIRSLRQLYATNFLVNAGRSKEVARVLDANRNADLEELLEEQDRLFVAAASEGTFWLTVLTKTRSAFRSLANIVPLFYEEGREALLERMRANTELAKLTVKEKEDKLYFDRANKSVDLVQKIEKIKDPHVKERVQDVLSASLGGLGRELPALPKPTEAPTSKQLKRVGDRALLGRITPATKKRKRERDK